MQRFTFNPSVFFFDLAGSKNAGNATPRIPLKSFVPWDVMVPGISWSSVAEIRHSQRNCTPRDISRSPASTSPRRPFGRCRNTLSDRVSRGNLGEFEGIPNKKRWIGWLDWMIFLFCWRVLFEKKISCSVVSMLDFHDAYDRICMSNMYTSIETQAKSLWKMAMQWMAWAKASLYF